MTSTTTQQPAGPVAVPPGKQEPTVQEALGRWLLLGCASIVATLLAVGIWLGWALWASAGTR